MSGILLDKYFPDPHLFGMHEAWFEAAKHMHYIWCCFAGIALVSAVALIIYGQVIKRIDRQKQIAN
jgi:hypothetical protein